MDRATDQVKRADITAMAVASFVHVAASLAHEIKQPIAAAIFADHS